MDNIQHSPVWKHNLAVLWPAQFMAMLGFSVTLPILPLFVHQELGVSDTELAAFWVGLSGFTMGLGMFIAGPIWGIVGDRYGRKKMVLRALFGTMVLVGLTGVVTDPLQLVILRLFSGLVSGIISPSLALVISMAPRNRVAFVVGVLQMSMFAAFTVGPVIGGVLVNVVGFRIPFFISAGLIGIAGLLVFALVRENFQRQQETEVESLKDYARGFFSMIAGRSMFITLLIVALGNIASVMVHPVLPLFIDYLSPKGASSYLSGVTFSIMGLCSAIAAVTMAPLSTRLGLKPILIVSSLMAGLVYLSMIVVDHPYEVIFVTGIVALFSGAVVSTGSVLVAAIATKGRYSRAFGAVQSVSSMGYGVGPLLGGSIAQFMGLRPVFIFSSAVFVLVAVVVWRFVSIRESSTSE